MCSPEPVSWQEANRIREKFCCGGTGLLEDSPKESWEGALTCSLLPSLCFQESGKQGEGLRLGTVLTASASDQH